MNIIDKERRKGFTQGVVYVIAQVIRNDPIDAEGLWNESGFTKEDLRVCDNYDADEIRKMLKKMQ